MDKLDHPEINTSELTAEVRKAMVRHVLKSPALPTNPAAGEENSSPASTPAPEKDDSTPTGQLSTDTNFTSLNSPPDSLPKSPRLELQPAFEPNTNDEYQLNDLLKFHDADFLNAAYRAVLKRDPDSFGYDHYLEHLREGHLDKVDVLASLRFSTEGERNNVRIKGLGLPTFIRRLSHLPVIGYPIRLGLGLLRLPVLIHRLRQVEAYSLAQDRKAAEHANEVAEHVDTVNATLAGYLSNLSAAIPDLLQRSETQVKQQLDMLVEQQQKTVLELRQEFRVQMDEERAGAQQQTEHLIQEQQSLFDSSIIDTRAKIAGLESSTRAWIAELESSVRAELAALGNSTSEIRTKIAEAESATGDLRARIGSVESSANDLRSATDKLESSTNTAQAGIEKVFRQLQHARTELALQGRRMALILEEARSRLPGPLDERQLESIAREEQHNLDALYAEIEDTFRGSPEEIKERFKTYLPHIKSLLITDEMPVVDLGCGRGEWLELLKEEGYRALGVDTNHVMLERCRARGLEVIESHALRYLRGLPDASLSAITGFHIIEHLQIEVLMELLDEIVRVLHPGGVVILETPNPENVLVGSNYFYFDPTHRNPLPSQLMNLLLTSRGLQRIEVMNLHGWDTARISGENELTARFNDLFYGPMDYAILGWKVSE